MKVFSLIGLPVGTYEIVSGKSIYLPIGTKIMIVNHIINGKIIVNLSNFNSYPLGHISKSVKVKKG
jgi:hypothetical protein